MAFPCGEANCELSRRIAHFSRFRQRLWNLDSASQSTSTRCHLPVEGDEHGANSLRNCDVERIGRTKRQIQTAQKHGRGSQVTGRHLDPLQSRNQAIEAIERRSSFACAELLDPDPSRGSRCKLGGGEITDD